MGEHDQQGEVREGGDGALGAIQAIGRPPHKGDEPEPAQPGCWKRHHESLRTIATVRAAVCAAVALGYNYRALTGAQRSWVLYDNEAANFAGVLTGQVSLF